MGQLPGRPFRFAVRPKARSPGRGIVVPLVLDYAEPSLRWGLRYSPGVIFMCRLKALVNAATDS